MNFSVFCKLFFHVCNNELRDMCLYVMMFTTICFEERIVEVSGGRTVICFTSVAFSS
jgi:hypothetical protein